MDLSSSRLLFLDCQTTGMQPSSGSLLELAWGFGRAQDSNLEILQSELIQLPEGKTIPASVQELTGIKPTDLQTQPTLEEVFQKFQASYQAENHTDWAVIHYAQFEKSFLEDLYLKMTGQKDLPFRILCSQKMAHRVFPHLPSRNIRGLAGLFGEGLGELKRASSHVQATFQIWRRIVEELQTQGISTFDELETWMKVKTPKPKVTYQYKIDREKRLKLPKKPGVYYMKSKTGTILYVGKATSLRDRVNSYFRGKKGRDTKKLEMLTQVWDLDFVETGSALEAALLESDEIKKWNPAYNISLKTGSRGLVYYSKNFEQIGFQQNEMTCIGPFRTNGTIEQLRLLQKSLKEETFYPIFYEIFPLELMTEAFHLFCEKHQVQPSQMLSIRSQLCLGAKIWRSYKRELGELLKLEAEELSEADSNSDSNEEKSEMVMDSIEVEAATASGTKDEDLEALDEVEITALDLADKFERLFMRSYEEIRKAKMLTQLLNCHLEWESELGWKSLEIRQGKFQVPEAGAADSFPWRHLTIADYDRMSIVFSEISRKPHRIRKLMDLTQDDPAHEPHRTATLLEY